MNTPFRLKANSAIKGLMPALLIAAGLALGTMSVQADQPGGVLRPNRTLQGQTYGQWSAAWWQWSLSHPVAGHPFVDDPSFNVASGQSGNVWFLASPFGTVERHVTIPRGKSLVIGLLNAEASDLEGLGATEAEQRDTAKFLADHIVNVSCKVDGERIHDIGDYRVASPQFPFAAPTPWIFGDTGGAGTAVADGYFVILKPLSKGRHTIRIRGSFHFSVAEGDPFDFDAAADVTYHLTVREAGHGEH